MDLSTDEEPGPTLVLSATFSEGSDRGGATWQTGPASVFEPGLPDEESAEIRIDDFASGVEPDGRDGIRVNAVFSRPVRLRASLLGDPCLIGPEPSFESAGLRETHSFRLDGLCLRTLYSVALEVEDEFGNTATFADVTYPPIVPGARYFDGTGWSDGYRVEYSVSTSGVTSGDFSPPGVHLARYEVTIDGEDFDLASGIGIYCFAGDSSVTPATGTDTWSDEVSVTINFAVEQRAEVPGPQCPPHADHRLRHWYASVTADFTIADFESGEITIPFEARDPAFPDSTVNATLTITGRVTE